jgi:competence protein ComEA
VEPVRPIDRRHGPRLVAARTARVRATIAWLGAGRIATGLLGAALAAAAGWWLLRPTATPVEQALPFAATTTREAVSAGPPTAVGTAAGGPTSGRETLVVHVAGAVVHPGVYELAAGARVRDAVNAAGGPAADADLDAMNLAAPVRDGERVYVPLPGEAPGPAVIGGGSGASGVPGPVDLNVAGEAELDALPGIGPALAAAIVADREANGPFATVDDLLRVRGIGPAKLDQFRDRVTV